jgi:hypothetical protein
MESPEGKESRVVSARVIKWEGITVALRLTMQATGTPPTSSGPGNRHWPRLQRFAPACESLPC